ncbi:MAG: hypothetical protein U0989_07835 [Azonexus sp.]|nr:hypothetical protein [Azonexus sp.]MDZ4314660.1 hypothetical protein [Azonexus sp.]
MSPAISKLYQVKNGGELSPQECQKINTELSMIEANDIPKEQRENVADYLASAFNHHSVQPQVARQLEALLQELQENA